MKKLQKGPLEIYQFENLPFNFVTTRSGGFSDPPYNSFNLSFKVPDDPKAVADNRKLLAEELGFDIEKLMTADQVHGDHIEVVRKDNIGKGIFKATDAMITSEKGVVLMVLTADCVPILFYDSKMKIVAAVHAGWRGTSLRIAQKTLQKMMDEFGTDPKDIRAGIGPCIGSCCYEVGGEVVEEILKNLSHTNEILQVKGGKDYLDLPLANKLQLTDLGVLPENIEISGICTRDNSKEFFSSRASGGICGRGGAGIGQL